VVKQLCDNRIMFLLLGRNGGLHAFIMILTTVVRVRGADHKTDDHETKFAADWLVRSTNYKRLHALYHASRQPRILDDSDWTK
jgi:hypothetical protein